MALDGWQRWRNDETPLTYVHLGLTPASSSFSNRAADSESAWSHAVHSNANRMAALTMNSQLREHPSIDSPYSLDIVQMNHETLLIFVRYAPTVNRESMNRSINTAREVIMITAKSYGWDNWVKIQERVEMYPPTK